jgi:RNA exonuclease 1
VSLDCEMAYTTMGMELVRVTVLDDNDRLVFDLLVRPEGEIYDFNTRFSGITLQKFESQVTVSFDEAREMLRHYVSADTVIIGHGLENDLVALRILHFALVDTALVFPHPRGRPYRLGLKDLMVRECGLEIQTAGEEGHDSVEDAGAASLLVRKRIRGDAFPGPFTK